MAAAVWRYIVRPIAVGGMLVGAAYTLFRMRDSLASGLKRAVNDIKQTAEQAASLSRTERYMSSKVVFSLIGVVFVVMIALYIYFSGQVAGRNRGGRRHADHGLLLRHRLRQPGAE